MSKGDEEGLEEDEEAEAEDEAEDEDDNDEEEDEDEDDEEDEEEAKVTLCYHDSSTNARWPWNNGDTTMKNIAQ